MKHAILFIIVLVIAGFGYSCRKCITCNAYDRQSHALVNTSEFCDTRPNIEDYKTYYENLWNDTYTYPVCE